MKRQKGYDHLVKLLIIGNSGVGKTNLLLRFVQDNFLTSHLSTIGIDFKTKFVNMRGLKVKLQIWDTAGQERFKTITQTYYRGAMGIILTYAIDDRSSFEQLQNWINQIKMHAAHNVAKILVGNKCDSDKRVVSWEEGSKLAKTLEVDFFQTSALEDKNVSEMFMSIGAQASNLLEIDKIALSHSQASEVGTSRGFLNGNSKSEKKKKCC